VNKSELIDQIAKSADISKAAAGRALDATTDAISKSLKNTGATIQISAANTPKFRAGKALKDAVN